MAATAKKDERSFTIMILPHSGERTLSFPLKVWWFKAGAAFLTIALLAGCTFCIRYARVTISVSRYSSELKRLREENSQQKALIEDYRREATEVEERLDRLEALDQQIRDIINKETAVLSSRSGGSQSRQQPGQRPREQKIALAEVSRGGLSSRHLGLFTEFIEEAGAREESLLSLKQGLLDTVAFLKAKPSTMPALGWVTSAFGYRRSPVSRSRSEFHEGIDIGAPYGSPVRAAGDGVVVYAGYHGGLGRTVIIDHGFGIRSWYGHCCKILVRQGEKVTRGHTIAQVGSSGLSTGPHLHYQVTVNATYVDPRDFFEVSEIQ